MPHHVSAGEIVAALFQHLHERFRGCVAIKRGATALVSTRVIFVHEGQPVLDRRIVLPRRVAWIFQESCRDRASRVLNTSRVQRGAYRGGRIVQKEDWVPMGLRRQSNHMRSGGGYARKNKNLGTRSLQDRHMPIDKRVRAIKS